MRYHPIAQGVGGFIAGLGLGVVPFAGVGEGLARDAGWIAQGTREANIGKGLGEIVGGLLQVVAGGGGVIGGGAASGTGVGAPVGVPVVVASAAMVAGGPANVASGDAVNG